MAHDEHWYEIVEAENLRQGDILRSVAIPYFDDDITPLADQISAAADGERETDVPVAFARSDWIVLDASCDIDHGPDRKPAVHHVFLARVFPADQEGLRARNDKELCERREALRQGLSQNKFLLPGCERVDPTFPLSYVEYRQRFALPHAYVLESATRLGARLRLRHPLRERFGNWVGAAISRVGPEDDAAIPPFVSPLHQAQQLRAVEALGKQS